MTFWEKKYQKCITHSMYRWEKSFHRFNSLCIYFTSQCLLPLHSVIQFQSFLENAIYCFTVEYEHKILVNPTHHTPKKCCSTPTSSTTSPSARAMSNLNSPLVVHPGTHTWPMFILSVHLNSKEVWLTENMKPSIWKTVGHEIFRRKYPSFIAPCCKCNILRDAFAIHGL